MRSVLVVGLFLGVLVCSAQQTPYDSFAERARTLAKSGKTDSSSVYFDKAIAAARDRRDSLAMAALLTEKGKVHETAGNYAQAISAYIEGLNIAKRHRDKLNEGNCYLGLSDANFRVANNEAAWAHGLQAVSCFELLHDTAHYVNASMLVGQIEISLGKLDEATAIYKRMLAVAKQIGDSTLIADNLDHLGVLHSFRKEFSKALPLHEEAMEINRKIRNEFNLAINYANIGEVYMRLRDFSKAREFLARALDLEKKLNANSVMIFTHYTLGECCSLMGQPADALAHFKQSLELIGQQGEVRERPSVYSLLSEHYERNHDYQRSLLYFRKASAERDSLRIVSSSYAMEELKVIYEAGKRENDLKSALLENNLKDSRLASSSQTITWLFVAIATFILGLMITVVLTIRLYKNERKLKLANKTKDALLSIIGHDLRGPMTSIAQLTRLIKLSDGQDREECIRMLEKPINTTVHLLDDLLAWSKSTRLASASDKTDVPLHETIGHAAGTVHDQAAAKQIVISNNVPPGITVFADVNHVSSVLRNLISNAIKFTPKGGHVVIDHAADDRQISIRITDTGLGIEPQNIKLILNSRFFSTHGTQNEKGSGFGLMLCQEFIRLNNGTLNIESKVGEGTTVVVTLPKGAG